MRVYASTDPNMPLEEVGPYAQRVERMGFDGLRVPETIHDGLMVSLLALEHTTRLHVRSSVILAFPRSPMVVAYAAWDLQRMSGGRFGLGLGTQIRANIEGRFSVPWRAPVARMREYLQALHAIFAAFQEGAGLDFEGEHYRFTRLQPYFNPGPIEAPPPPLTLGAVNRRLCELAGELCDGLVTHPTNSSPRYLREVTRPALAAGAERGERRLEEIELVAGTSIITGRDAAELALARDSARRSLAFLYSTPTYWPTLEAHGWGDLGQRLRELTREGRWDDLPALLGDEVLDALVPQGTYGEIADVLLDRYRGLADGLGLAPPEDPAHDDEVAAVIRRLQEG